MTSFISKTDNNPFSSQTEKRVPFNLAHVSATDYCTLLSHSHSSAASQHSVSGENGARGIGGISNALACGLLPPLLPPLPPANAPPHSLSLPLLLQQHKSKSNHKQFRKTPPSIFYDMKEAFSRFFNIFVLI
jgi:hypothetical protein